MIPDADCDGGYTCPSSEHIEGCFRPHVERELLPSTHQVIPEEAVEAAARLIHSQHETSPLDEWSAIFQRQAKASARLVLEAAAPHLIQAAKAEAWDEGAAGGLSWDENLGEDFKTPNPYR